MSAVGVCIRLDDYDSRTPPAVLDALEEIFARHQVTCLYGVIPFHSSPGKGQLGVEPLSAAARQRLRELVDRGLVTPALHGYVHLRGPDGQPEFEHGTTDEQYEKLASGKALLEDTLGAQVHVFVPPWNGVSSATEAALKKLNIAYVSTSIEMGETGRWSMPDIPSTSFWNNRDAIRDAQSHCDNLPLVVLTGHFYDFHDKSGELDSERLAQFDEMLAWISAQENVALISFDEAYRRVRRSGRMWRAVHRCRFAWDMPHRLRTSLRWPRWLPTRDVGRPLRHMRNLGLAVWATVVISAIALGAAAALLAGADVRPPARIAMLLVAILALLGGAWYPFQKQAARALALTWGGACLGIALLAS